MTNKVIDEVKKIRDSLKHAWVPFFTKFGRLTPVQIKTIPEVLNKKKCGGCISYRYRKNRSSHSSYF